ncbi:glycosyltransferase 87 family protein [Streptomyces sp. NBC_01565]|uniref:glycosyltransferase 87 family protein n=1 Tax=unclassified Streptomyces TaxID=2593676 RepID=UPI0022551F15|nr:glycosyltransferase 87 family protein [Streptomyces sp. NBC_01565]MCX4546320.1 glycosyltransferase 87 family protein [Streptomyces sp. NBC_01565]
MSQAARKQESRSRSAAKPFPGGRRWDRAVLAACAVSALVVGLASPSHTSQKVWGLIGAAGYACSALVAARSPTPWARAPAVVAVIGAAVIPLSYLSAIGRAQMEVGVVERAADLLFSTGTPYNAAPHAVRDFNPYLPGMALFGIPHLLFGDTPLASARLWFLVGFLAAVAQAVRVLTRGGERAAGANGVASGASGLTGALWLIACPVVALPLSIGGVDPPVIGLLCLALAFTQRGHAGRAGLVVGAAAVLKWTAWPAIPVIVAVLALRGGKRAAFTCAAAATGLAALTVTPVALADTSAFYQNVVLYPLGLGPTASSAQSPLLGHLIVLLLPHGKAVTTVLIALSAVGVGASLLVRPPQTTVAAADRLALGLLLAIALSPATRIGYAVYPVVLIAWPRFTARLTTDRPVAAPRPPGGEPPHHRRTVESRLCTTTAMSGPPSPHRSAVGRDVRRRPHRDHHESGARRSADAREPR